MSAQWPQIWIFDGDMVAYKCKTRKEALDLVRHKARIWRKNWKGATVSGNEQDGWHFRIRGRDEHVYSIVDLRKAHTPKQVAEKRKFSADVEREFLNAFYGGAAIAGFEVIPAGESTTIKTGVQS